jgi:hypothetical protein
MSTAVRIPVLISVFILVFAAAVPALIAQQRSATTVASGKKSSFTLAVKSGQLIGVSLKAKEAKLAEIAADLASRLKVKVVLSPSLTQQTVSVNFSQLALEPALQLLAPQVFVDYQIDGPKQTPVGIFLYGYDDSQPAVNAVVTGSSEALLIEGDTEDGVEPTTEEGRKRIEDDPLKIRYVNNRLSLKTNKQPLSLVLLKLGSELGIPVELREDNGDLITTELAGLSLEEVVQRLSPHIRLYVRADLQRLERRPLRMVLLAPESQSRTISTEP